MPIFIPGPVIQRSYVGICDMDETGDIVLNVGFRPTSVILRAFCDGGVTETWSIGSSDGTRNACIYKQGFAEGCGREPGEAMLLEPVTGNVIYATVTFSASGFIIHFTLVGATILAYVQYHAFR